MIQMTQQLGWPVVVLYLLLEACPESRGTVSRPHTPQLQTLKAFVDAGWFLDAPKFLGSGFTFSMLSQLLKTSYGATYDK